MAPRGSFSTAPYPGLRPFESEEQDIFFGRETQTDQLLSKLEAGRFLAVVGPSGCGKSSLVRAGLIACLETGMMASAGSRWRIITLRPGRSPIARLAHRLAAVDKSGVHPLTQAELSIEAALRRGPLGLIDSVRESHASNPGNLLLLVDQFEELFRFRAEGNPDEADAFVNLLLRAADQQAIPIYIVLTMRSDFLGQCALFHGLPEAISESQYLTPRLTRDECARAIAGPARVFGGEVDGDLVHQLLNDLGPNSDQLPVMQHALMRMWTLKRQQQPEGRIVLTVQGYEQIGGLKYALSKHADEAFFDLPERGQALARVVFQRISSRTAGELDTRAPAPAGTIARVAGATVAEIVAVADAFRRPDRSFLAPPAGEAIDAETFLDVSHESFIAHWDRLFTWVREEAESAAGYARLKKEAALWRKGESALWGSPNLERALDWKKRTRPNPAWAERYGSAADFDLAMDFLAASEAKRIEKQLRIAAARDRELRRARLVAFASGLLALSLVLGIVLYRFLWVWPSSAYFRSFVVVYGVGKGVDPVTPTELEHRVQSVRVVTQGVWGQVLRVEMVDGRGTLTSGITTYLDASPSGSDLAATLEYVYDRKRKVLASFAYGEQHEPLWGIQYVHGDSPAKATIYKVGADSTPAPKAPLIDIEYSGQGYEKVLHYHDRSGARVPGRDRAFGLARGFDAAGRLVKMTSLDADGKPMNDAFGNATLRISYDAAGNVVLEEALDATGQTALTVDGWAVHKITYDRYGNSESESYFDVDGHPTLEKYGYHRVVYVRDEHGNLASESYTAEDGQPIANGSACYGTRRSFDPRGNVLEDTCVGHNGQPVRNKSGYAIAAFTYDDHDRMLSEVLRDAEGQECINDEGFSRMYRAYDSAGHLVDEHYAGLNGLPVINSSGFARQHMTTDRDGNVLTREYLGADGIRVVSEDGYAEIRNKYDTEGNAIEERYFGTAGAPTFNTKGEAGFRARYDEQGNELEHEWLDLTGGRAASTYGYAGWRSTFELGNEVRRAYFGLMGEPVADAEGVAGWTSEFDPRHKELRRMYFAADAGPALHKDGYAGWVAEYDSLGRQTELRYVDVKGAPAVFAGGRTNGTGYARVQSKFDTSGDLVEESYFGIHDEPVLGQEGYARKTQQFDERRHLTEIAYYGRYGEAVLVRGYHVVRFKPDAHGNDVEVSYYGPDGVTAVTSDEGASRLVRRFDDYGNATDESAFKTDAPTALLTGCRQTHIIYDGWGRKSALECRDDAGRLQLDTDGVSVAQSERDAQGRIVKTAYLGVGGEAVMGKKDRHAILRSEYDARGNAVCRRSFDARDKLVVDEDGNAVVRQKFDLQNRVIEWTQYGSDDKPTLGDKDYWKQLNRYDGLGRLVEVEYRDTSDRPVVVSSLGFAVQRTEYDERGHAVRIDLLDGSRNPILGHDRYARLDQKFNLRGQLIELSLYDASTPRKLVMGSSGYARETWAYDEDGRTIDIANFDASGKPVVSADGYAHLTRKYDARGNLIEEAYYGRDGSLFSDSEGGTVRWTGEYDEFGNRVIETHFDRLGVAFEQIKDAYDVHRRLVELRYFRGDGKAARMGRDGQHMTRFEYDDRGNKVGAKFFGVHNEPVQGYEDKKLCWRWFATYGPDGNQTGSGCKSLEAEARASN
jgi:hypothetical protein